MNYAEIKGFNYQPSYGSSGLEIWQQFDASIVDKELDRGKKYFPGMNAIRLWLSWDAFVRDQQRFSCDFELALATAEKYGLVVMPVLFNRWHSGVPDYGGIYADHFLPYLRRGRPQNEFEPYLEAIVGPHASDPRVFSWDLCNEPFYYACPPNEIPEITKAEYTWLEKTHDTCKRLGVESPVTIGMLMSLGIAEIRRVEPICDILSLHPYWFPSSSKQDFEKQLDDYVALAAEVSKPLLATETCWGSLNDIERV
jgi:endo-1,4-beta-mannosidase